MCPFVDTIFDVVNADIAIFVVALASVVNSVHELFRVAPEFLRGCLLHAISCSGLFLHPFRSPLAASQRTHYHAATAGCLPARLLHGPHK